MKRLLAFASLFLAMILSSSANPLKVGDPAPVASALSDAGEKVDLADVYAKNRYTLVYFYPRAGTPGCTAQGCSLRDAYESLVEAGVAVVGVSADSVAAQRRFKEAQRFPFTLLADTEKEVIEAFRVGSLFGYSSRQAYLIRDGKIVYADYKGTTKEQAADVLAFLRGERAATKE